MFLWKILLKNKAESSPYKKKHKQQHTDNTVANINKVNGREKLRIEQKSFF